MAPDLTTAHSEDRFVHPRTWALIARSRNQCDHAACLSRRRGTNLSPICAFRNRARKRHRDRTRTLASHVPALHVVGTGAGG
jgi:hypothetical protein